MVQAKCKCISVTDYGAERDVTLRPVYDSNPGSPNYQWSKYTPDGEIRLKITNPGAFEQFVPGGTYLVSFQVAPE
jgi:hypothetical protein